MAIPTEAAHAAAPSHVRYWAVAAVVVACVASGCSGPDSGDGGRTIPSPAIAASFAPQVNLAGHERWLPLDAREFIDNSVLHWLDSCGGSAFAAGRLVEPGSSRQPLPTLRPSRLVGEFSYEHAPRRPPECEPSTSESFTTADYTHPYDVLRPNNIAYDEGFYLDLADQVSAGRRPDRGVPAYYEIARERVKGAPALRITYWMLFGRDAPAIPRSARRQSTHEGDWERVAVMLRPAANDRYRPFAVRYYTGRDYAEVAWGAARRLGSAKGGEATHPVVYSARGSHTIFPTAGRYPYTVQALGEGGGGFTVTDVAPACPRCIRWRTWRELRAARAEPWYGYGGGWGDTGADDANAGPLGPSWYANQSEAALRARGN